MYDDGVVKRFQAERQSLAMMDHPDGDPRFDTLVADAQKGAASPVRPSTKRMTQQESSRAGP